MTEHNENDSDVIRAKIPSLIKAIKRMNVTPETQIKTPKNYEHSPIKGPSVVAPANLGAIKLNDFNGFFDRHREAIGKIINPDIWNDGLMYVGNLSPTSVKEDLIEALRSNQKSLVSATFIDELLSDPAFEGIKFKTPENMAEIPKGKDSKIPLFQRLQNLIGLGIATQPPTEDRIRPLHEVAAERAAESAAKKSSLSVELARSAEHVKPELDPLSEDKKLGRVFDSLGINPDATAPVKKQEIKSSTDLGKDPAITALVKANSSAVVADKDARLMDEILGHAPPIGPKLPTHGL